MEILVSLKVTSSLRKRALNGIALTIVSVLLFGLWGCSGCPPTPAVSPSPSPSPSPGLSANQIRQSRWGVPAQPLFGLDRGAAPELEAIPSRTLGRPPRGVTRPENPTAYLEQMDACVGRYQQEWGAGNVGTVGVLGNLRRPNFGNAEGRPDCWTPEQNVEVIHLEQAIETDLVELRPLIDRHEVGRIPQIETLLSRLGRNYQEVQENISYCRLRDVTKNLPAIAPLALGTDPTANAEDRALLHVVGDVFGKGSGLEGQSIPQASNLLERRRLVIESLAVRLNEKKYIATELQAEPCLGILGGYHPGADDHGAPFVDFSRVELLSIVEHINGAIALMRTFQSSMTEFRAEFSRQLERLTGPSDWFYFIGGSLKNAVIYQVIRKEGNRYSFRVYNSRVGSNFHASILNGSNIEIFPFIERQNVSREKLARFAFLKSLRDLQVQEPQITNSKISFLYDNLLQELGGELATVQAQVEDFLDPQIAGTSSYYAVPFMEASRLGKLGLGAHLEFFIKSKLLDVYFRVNENRLREVEPALRLASESLTFYAEEVAKNISVDPGRKGRYLDWGMARETAERVEEYRRILNGIHTGKQIQRAVSAPRFDETALLGLRDHVLPGAPGFHLHPISREAQTTLTLSLFEIHEWTPNAAILNDDLNRFRIALSPAIRADSHRDIRDSERIVKGIPEIIKRIPLDQEFLNGPNFQMDAPSLTVLLGTLNDLSQMHFWALVTARTAAPANLLGLSSESILTQLKLLTLTNQVIRLLGTRPTGGAFSQLPSLYNSLIEPLLLGKASDQWTSILTIEDSNWTKSFKSMVDYWMVEKRSARIATPLFQWERFPIYTADESGTSYQRILFKTSSDMESSHWSQPFGNPEPRRMKWEDIKWASDFARSNHNNPSLLQVLQSLNYNAPNRLPIEFFEARDISFLSHYVLTGSFFAEILRSSGLGAGVANRRDFFSRPHLDRVSAPINFSVQPEPVPVGNARDQSRPWNHYKNNYQIFNTVLRMGRDLLSNPRHLLVQINADNPDNYTGSPTQSLELSGERAYLGPWAQILEVRDQLYASVRIGIPYYKRLSSGEIVSQPQDTHRVPLRKDPSVSRELVITTLEMQRQLLNLGSPLATLGYFAEHTNELREKRWQVIFKSLIF